MSRSDRVARRDSVRLGTGDDNRSALAGASLKQRVALRADVTHMQGVSARATGQGFKIHATTRVIIQAPPPPAPTALCYLRLSATAVMGLLSVATR
jgi:hypothetical protein